MSSPETPREQWSTRLGFVLAAVGSAVGLGNIWRFPFVTGEAGGAGFLFVYLIFVAAVGLPAILVEFVVGRRTRLNPVGALFVLGLAPAYDLVLLQLYDGFADGILLLLGGLLLTAYVSWRWSDEAIEELSQGVGRLGNLGVYWIWLARVPVLIVLFVSLVLGIIEYVGFIEDMFLPWLRGL